MIACYPSFISPTHRNLLKRHFGRSLTVPSAVDRGTRLSSRSARKSAACTMADVGQGCTLADVGQGTDVMAQYGLDGVLSELRRRKVRTTFAQYCADVPDVVIPIKARCPMGSLMEVAMLPVNEDERKLEPFDERVLRNALTLKESAEKPQLPKWLEEETPWPDEDLRRRRKKKKKRRRKRRRDGKAEGAEEAVLDEDERRMKKKRKKKREEE